MSEIKIDVLKPEEPEFITLFQRLENLVGQVRDRAYELSRIRTDAKRHEFDDWLQAEHEFLACQRCEVREEANQFVTEVDAEDFAPQDVKVTLLGNDLLIEGNSRRVKTENGVRDEMGRSVFVRAFLSDKFDAATLQAELHAGVLRVTAQKKGDEAIQSSPNGTVPKEAIQSEPERQLAASTA
jgi:HSP20 family molecular chaperone IbpA